MGVNSSSSTAQVRDAYDDNASYAEDNDLQKARRFITACRILLRRTSTNSVKGSNQVTLRVDLLQDELERAQEWLEARDPDQRLGPRIVKPDFRQFRRGPRV